VTCAVVTRLSLYRVLGIAHPLVSLVAASGASLQHRFFKEKMSEEEVRIKKKVKVKRVSLLLRFFIRRLFHGRTG
jgi:hypothetical protein